MDITEPTLLLNEDICKANIKRMAGKARQHGLAFKPHMKTHQSAEVGEWLKQEGAEAITVSSVAMAEYFSKYGWNDITIAFPCNVKQIERIDTLAGISSLTLLVNNTIACKKLDANLSNDVKVYIELDTGSNRTGLRVDNLSQIITLIDELNNSQRLDWIGFYSHPGHSYDSRNEKEIQQVHQSVIGQVKQLRNKLEPRYGKFQVCIGDTPCCSKAINFEGVDAMSPGNFVFYDLMQAQIGSCDISDIAVAMKCPVVDTYPDRNELAIYGGAIHFSKESVETESNTHYGFVASTESDHWEMIDQYSYIKALSQEHGIIKCSDQVFDQYQIGDPITILPVHSCLTANLMDQYHLKDGRVLNQL